MSLNDEVLWENSFYALFVMNLSLKYHQGVMYGLWGGIFEGLKLGIVLSQVKPAAGDL